VGGGRAHRANLPARPEALKFAGPEADVPRVRTHFPGAQVMRSPSIAAALILGLTAGPALAGQGLVAAPVATAPSVDGVADDPAWEQAEAIVTRDAVTGIDVTLRAVRTAEEVFIVVTFPDDAEDRAHKAMRWDRAQKRYRTGPEREDTFVLKWGMQGDEPDLSLSADAPYRADVWYWKAHRTDHTGRADDKIQTYSAVRTAGAKPLRSRNSGRFFLTRSGDAGEAAYASILHDGFSGDRVPKYGLREPTGSRADIRARGVWRDGTWTVEFARRLDTGHDDDVRFEPGRSYAFGISRHEIAGRRPDPRIAQPLFGSGEVGERLVLSFR
jgi:hypothetical protein